jgi:hypothetical protein
MDEVEVVGGEGERAGQGVEEAGGDGGAAGQPGDVGGEAQQVGIGIGADDRGGRGRRDRRSGGLAAVGGQERGAGQQDGPVAGGGGQVEDGAGGLVRERIGGPGEASGDERAEGAREIGVEIEAAARVGAEAGRQRVLLGPARAVGEGVHPGRHGDHSFRFEMMRALFKEHRPLVGSSVSKQVAQNLVKYSAF